MRRAAQWDGTFPIELPHPDALATLAAEVRELRPEHAGEFDVVAEIPPSGDQCRGARPAPPGFSPPSTRSRTRSKCAQ
jgi:hypothetical protein